jgi:F-box-like
MAPNSQIQFYARGSNDPLPSYLHVPIRSLLDKLDLQDRACDNNSRRLMDAIEEKQSQIRALENEITRLEVVRKRVVNTRASIAEKKTQYQATLSSIRRVPPEIIAKIMYLAVTSSSNDIGDFERHGFKSYRSVCKLWRLTALSTPYLWRSLSVRHNEFPFQQHQPIDPQRAERLTQSLRSWFSRGGEGAALEICFEWVSIEQAIWAMELARSLRLNLRRAAVHLDSDRYHKGGYYGLKFLEPSFPDSTDTLSVEDLEVCFGLPYASMRTNSREMMNISRHWPQLSSITLYCNMDLCPTSLTHHTLSNLTLFNVRLPETEVEFILSGLSQLQSLRLMACNPLTFVHGEVPDATTPYTHPSLKRLEFHRGVPEPFLSRLRCPSLNSLLAHGDPPTGMDRGLQLACLQRFVKRCEVSIQFMFNGETHLVTRR